MRMAEATQMYLETILVLNERSGHVRSVDVAEEMGYARATVSVRLKELVKNGLALVDEQGFIALTPAGREVAQKTWERHRVLTRLLMGIGVSERVASQDACRVEHYISEETFRCLLAHDRKRGGGDKPDESTGE